jgi:hypothetical protein
VIYTEGISGLIYLDKRAKPSFHLTHPDVPKIHDAKSQNFRLLSDPWLFVPRHAKFGFMEYDSYYYN